MGLGLRLYVVSDDESLVRIPWAKYERLLKRDGKEQWPQYAGRHIRCINVVLELVNRKPTAIYRIDHFYLKFDEEGRIDAEEEEKKFRLAADLIDLPDLEPGPHKVISASHRFAKRRLEHHYKWTPSDDILEKLMIDIFGTNHIDFF